MKSASTRFTLPRLTALGQQRILLPALAVSLAAFLGAHDSNAAEWRALPLIAERNVDPSWMHIGYGQFVVDDGALRTEPDPKGLGLLVYKKERLGNCQIRVVFKTKDARSNSGFYVRIDDGVLDQKDRPGAAFERDSSGKPSSESARKVELSADRAEGPWYAVHHGYEVQIAGASTGSIYSLAPTSAGANQPTGQWRTMIVTLDGDRIQVELDGKPCASFDSSSPNLPPQKIWHEPKREPRRPQAGYIGLQTHDPGDIVWFKEISVRPLPASTKAGGS